MVRKKRKRKRKAQQKNINWGQGMASFGDLNATLGLIFAWIMMFGFIGVGIYLIVKGAQGKSLGEGMCEDKEGEQSNGTCVGYFNENSCTSNTLCTWSRGKLSDGGKAGYIVGGLFIILFGICIVMIANWVRNKTRTDPNFAAVIGTGALVEGIVGVATSGR